MFSIRSTFIFIFFLTTSYATSKFDNEIIGLPRVSCERDNIRVKVQTARPFEGRFFVKGEFHNEHCGKSYSSGLPVSTPIEDAAPFIPDGPPLRGRPAAVPPLDSGSFQPESEAQKRGSVEGLHSPSRPSKEEWHGHGGSAPFQPGNPWVSVGGTQAGSILPRGKVSEASCPSVEEICPPCECGQHRQRREDANWVELVVPLGSCNAKRDRVMNPPSLVTSFVAIVSFHGSFITKVDRAYHIKCAFNESNLHVDTELNVTMKEGANLTGTSSPPSCEYRLLGEDGTPLRHVNVGDLVRHEWGCQGPKNSRVLVHDCYAEDGHGSRQQVIDEHGCSLDPYAIPTPLYDDATMVVHVDAYVFQFPDQASVSFQCAIRSCTGLDENCRELSPPQCGSNMTRRKRSATHGEEVMTIHSPTLTVIDLDGATSPSYLALSSPEPEPLCLSVASFGIAISLTTFLFTSSAGIVIVQFLYKRKI